MKLKLTWHMQMRLKICTAVRYSEAPPQRPCAEEISAFLPLYEWKIKTTSTTLMQPFCDSSIPSRWNITVKFKPMKSFKTERWQGKRVQILCSKSYSFGPATSQSAEQSHICYPRLSAEYEKTKKILDETLLPTLGRKSVRFYISLLTTCVSLTVVDRVVDKCSANTIHEDSYLVMKSSLEKNCSITDYDYYHKNLK